MTLLCHQRECTLKTSSTTVEDTTLASVSSTQGSHIHTAITDDASPATLANLFHIQTQNIDSSQTGLRKQLPKWWAATLMKGLAGEIDMPSFLPPGLDCTPAIHRKLLAKFMERLDCLCASKGLDYEDKAAIWIWAAQRIENMAESISQHEKELEQMVNTITQDDDKNGQGKDEDKEQERRKEDHGELTKEVGKSKDKEKSLAQHWH